jgi:phospholipid/cholesterol/gamma-HCH transport system substrate-binding protein
MNPRLVRLQLMIFTAVSVVTIVAIALFYLHLPAALGFGTYRVTANFIASGGLYENANVTYRGSTIGRVTAVRLTRNNGVDAQLKLNSDTQVPDNVTATVKSVSAIGEQYVDLVPPEQPAPGSLRDGSRVTRDHTAISQDVAGLLRETDKLLSTVNESRLRDLLRETFKAFDGSGPELARLIESSRLLVEEANANAAETTGLIDQAGPFLDAQIRSGDDIKTFAEGLARLTGEVRHADPQIRTLLQIAPSAIAQADTAFGGIRPSFPMLAANLANVGRIGVIYHKSIEQVLVLLPAVMAALTSASGELPPDEGTKSDFKISTGDPPPCSVGFLPPPQIRTPADETVRQLPTDMYCKVAQSDPSVVRGARNYPCQEFPGKRAPTVQLCRDPIGYVPIGSNPWRGPPVPYGTRVTDDRNILPPNKFPNIPPQADYDPGPPVVGPLPPGIQPGPGPAPNAPFPLPVPPVGGPPPAPYPNQSPPSLRVPPYGVPPADVPPAPDPLPAETPNTAPPQASGPAYATYDQNSGQFLDPNGDVGVFNAGATKHLPPENWADLMLYPRKQ